MAEIAREDGQTELQLRRATKDLNDAVHRSFGEHGVTVPFRDFITYGCITYAAELISHGVKVEAAMTLAGFKNWTNFVRQCRAFLGCAPHDLKRRSG